MNYSSMKEHDPIYSDVYQTPSLEVLLERRSQSPQPPHLRVSEDQQAAMRKSPVADLLPGASASNNKPGDSSQSQTRAAVFQDSDPVDPDAPIPEIKIPLYEVRSYFKCSVNYYRSLTIRIRTL